MKIIRMLHSIIIMCMLRHWHTTSDNRKHDALGSTPIETQHGVQINSNDIVQKYEVYLDKISKACGNAEDYNKIFQRAKKDTSDVSETSYFKEYKYSGIINDKIEKNA